MLAFAAVLLVLAAAVAIQVRALRGMDAILESMEEHERLIGALLSLEEAVGEALAQAGQGPGVAYRRASDEARRLFGELGAHLPSSAEAGGLLARASEAFGELDRAVREAPAPPAAPTPERGLGPGAAVQRDLAALRRLVRGILSDSRRELDRIHEGTTRWTQGLLAFLPLLVAGAGLYLWRSIARPLALLSQGAARVAGGDLRTRIPVADGDEFGHLAREFNAMTAALQEHQERLVESEKLAGIGRLAAGVAHEINNPLQVMIGYLSLHRDHPDRALAEQLAAVEDEALRCRVIVDDLLELSRPAGTSVPVDLRALCDEVIERLRSSQREAASEISVEGAGVAVADPPRVRQVVLNLVRNALEAAGPRGGVRVRVGPCPRGVEVSVGDTGPGVPPDLRARLFEPFFTTKPGGTGMGLAVSRAIARAHGGDLDLSSVQGSGAVFRLWLPVAAGGS